ncbi:hypothetical protein [Barnesiella sp. WM24]|uniref:hypothetical protein n=1 Tax=Barnesiella sp. WM24 TaxID=2558278 RepID=UPI00352EFDD5
METNYVYIFDFTQGILNIIHLTSEEVEESQKYESFEDFLITLEEKYGFNLSNCQWMCSETMKIYLYQNGKEADAPLLDYIKQMLHKSEKDRQIWDARSTESFKNGDIDLGRTQSERRAIALGEVRAYQHILSKLEFPLHFQRKHM